jgi:hypothetical protein
MRTRSRGQFLLGLVGGFLLGLVGLLLAGIAVGSGEPAVLFRQLMESLAPLWEMAQQNLQGSVLPFVLVLLAYLQQLVSLRGLLATDDPPVDRVARHEQLLDLCANLFFGIGVIWTAIGMRDALLFALGEPDAAAAQGAFTVLQRMVDGGILLALSTTIVGGIGGYLMKAGKSILLGQQLSALYLRTSREASQENLVVLQRIEAHLSQESANDSPLREAP